MALSQMTRLSKRVLLGIYYKMLGLGKLVALPICLFIFTSCQLGYLIETGYDHLAMLSTKVPLDKALKSDKLTEDQKKKIELSQIVRLFAFDELKLHRSDNYTQYVQLDRPYITYTVMASYKWKFEPYLWTFPFIGDAPYKGYYNEKSALSEAEVMRKKDFDVFVRGVAAYSTLGKLTDPLLSSMLYYKPYDLVNTIIHELVHTTLFIKDNIDFNERLAVFVAAKGTELFYLKTEGANSKTLELIRNEYEDDRLFSEFITNELNDLKKWYEQFDPNLNTAAEEKEKLRQERLSLILTHFKNKLSAKLKTNSYSKFAAGELNNAKLSNYNTYMKDLNDFEKVYIKTGQSIPAFLEKCKELNTVDDPELELKKWASE